MSFHQRRTVARFLLPLGGSVTTEDREVPPGHRDPEVPTIGVPPHAIGVTFFDQVVAEVIDPSTDQPILCFSDPLDPSPGTHFYRGMVASLKEISDGTITFPLLIQQATLAKMHDNSWSKVIYFEGGKIILPYDSNKDSRRT